MKSNKQKCLEMWEWLRDNPEKGKWAYFCYLDSIGKAYEYNYCWACEEAEKDCSYCPLAFFYNHNGETDCMEPSSPYYKWGMAVDEIERREMAEEMVELIITTWEE